MNDTRNTRELPEKIQFIDGTTNEVFEEVNFADVPDYVRFVSDETGIEQPVIKIVHITSDDRRTIKQYGYGDVILRSTLQFLEK